MARAVVFLFMSFVFAFFYLRALNSNHSFLHAARQAARRLGRRGAGLRAGRDRRLRGGAPPARATARAARGGWAPALATVLALAAVALQAIEYFNLSFGAADGGLASVFFGFTAVFVLFWLGAVYWIETLWAQSLRQPDAGRRRRQRARRAMLRPSADGCVALPVRDGRRRDPRVHPAVPGQVIAAALALIADAGTNATAAGPLTLVIPVGVLIVVLAVWWAVLAPPPRTHLSC